MSNLIERVKTQVIEAIQNIDSLEELESVLDGVGLEVTGSSNGAPKAKNGRRKATKTKATKTKAKNGRKASNGRRRKKAGHAPAAKRYWNQIRKIMRDEGVNPTDARAIYARRQDESSAAPKRKVSAKVKKATSLRQRKYWKLVDKTAIAENCSKAKARQIIKKRKEEAA